VLADVHEIPVSVLLDALVMNWTVQLAPSQTSAKGKGPVNPTKSPTATQAVGEAQDTLVKTTPLFRGFGIVWIDHVVPSQPSARGTGPDGPSNEPTASQALAEEHETPVSPALAPVLGVF
jgi:hypothetical protein